MGILERVFGDWIFFLTSTSLDLRRDAGIWQPSVEVEFRLRSLILNVKSFLVHLDRFGLKFWVKYCSILSYKTVLWCLSGPRCWKWLSTIWRRLGFGAAPSRVVFYRNRDRKWWKHSTPIHTVLRWVQAAHNNKDNNNEFNARFVFIWRHRGRPFHAIMLFCRNEAMWDMHGREESIVST